MIRAAKSDPKKFGEIYDCFSRDIYRYMLSRTGSVDTADDLTAQTFLSAFEGLVHYRERGKFKSWLFTIASNKCASYFREVTKNSRLENTLTRNSSHQSNPNQLKRVIRNNRIRKLVEIIEELPESDQELLRLRFVAELSYPEIAEVIGKTSDAVRKAIYRLQDLLKVRMEVTHE